MLFASILGNILHKSYKSVQVSAFYKKTTVIKKQDDGSSFDYREE